MELTVLHIAGESGLLESVGDISFVIKLMALVYIVFYLYQTFAESQVLFGLATLGAGYFILFYSSVFVALAIVVLLMVTGMWLQQSLQFGLFPLLGVGQQGMAGGGGQEEMRAIQQKMQLGQQLSEREQQMAASMEQQQMQSYNSQYMQAGMRRRG